MLNTLHLQTFLAVVEAGNYSAAAERLHMSQPAVSQHIRALEDQLDHVRLFQRVGQQMEASLVDNAKVCHTLAGDAALAATAIAALAALARRLRGRGPRCEGK